jgi:biotin operon repressor
MSYRFWSNDEIARLDDLCGDQFPLRAIAQRLGRSRQSVSSMMKKLKLRGRLASTRGQGRHWLHIGLPGDVYRAIASRAVERCVPVTTFCSMLIEMLARWPNYLDTLLSPEHACAARILSRAQAAQAGAERHD